jgi:hypothetical protein
MVMRELVRKALMPPDPLKHFSKDSCWVRLTALVIVYGSKVLYVSILLATALVLRQLLGFG